MHLKYIYFIPALQKVRYLTQGLGVPGLHPLLFDWSVITLVNTRCLCSLMSPLLSICFVFNFFVVVVLFHFQFSLPAISGHCFWLASLTTSGVFTQSMASWSFEGLRWPWALGSLSRPLWILSFLSLCVMISTRVFLGGLLTLSHNKYFLLALF